MELYIHACEGGFYLAKLQDGDTSDEALRSKCLKHGIFYEDSTKFHSLSHIRDFFNALAPERVWLVHNHAYDEMIGQRSGPAEHKQPLNWYGSEPVKST